LTLRVQLEQNAPVRIRRMSSGQASEASVAVDFETCRDASQVGAGAVVNQEH